MKVLGKIARNIRRKGAKVCSKPVSHAKLGSAPDVVDIKTKKSEKSEKSFLPY